MYESDKFIFRKNNQYLNLKKKLILCREPRVGSYVTLNSVLPALRLEVWYFIYHNITTQKNTQIRHTIRCRSRQNGCDIKQLSGYVKLTYNSELFPPVLYSAPVPLLVAVIKTKTLILLFERTLVQYVLRVWNGFISLQDAVKHKNVTLQYRPQNGASVMPISAIPVHI